MNTYTSADAAFDAENRGRKLEPLTWADRVRIDEAGVDSALESLREIDTEEHLVINDPEVSDARRNEGYDRIEKARQRVEGSRRKLRDTRFLYTASLRAAALKAKGL